MTACFTMLYAFENIQLLLQRGLNSVQPILKNHDT